MHTITPSARLRLATQGTQSAQAAPSLLKELQATPSNSKHLEDCSKSCPLSSERRSASALSCLGAVFELSQSVLEFSQSLGAWSSERSERFGSVREEKNEEGGPFFSRHRNTGPGGITRAVHLNIPPEISMVFFEVLPNQTQPKALATLAT
jgi:hypothetical protein